MLSFWIAVASIIAFVLSTLSNLKNATSLKILRWSKLIGAAASSPSVLPLHRFEVVNVALPTFPPRAYSDGRREDGRWGVQTRPGSRGTSGSPFLGLPTPTTPVATFHLCDDRALQHEVQTAVSVVSRPNGARSVLFPTTSRDVDVATEFPPSTPNAHLAHISCEGIPLFVEESDPIFLSGTGKTSAEAATRSTLKFPLPCVPLRPLQKDVACVQTPGASALPMSLDTTTTDDPRHKSAERQPFPDLSAGLRLPPSTSTDCYPLKQDICLVLAALRSSSIPQFDPYELHPQSASTISSAIPFEDELARLPSSGSTLLKPLTTASVDPCIRRQPGKAVDVHASSNLNNARVSSRVITESTDSSCGVEAVVSIPLTDSSISAETGHPNVPGDVAEALDIFVPARPISDGDDAWLVLDVKRTAIRESQDVSPRLPADIPLTVEGHVGNPLPRSISLTESSSISSQHHSTIPRRVHLASSLLYQPSGSSGVSLAALPPQTNPASRPVPVLESSAPAQPEVLAIANVRSAVTIRFEDGKQSMQCQTPLLVSEFVLRGLPKESSFRSRKCEKLGKGGFGSVRRHEERNGKTVTRVSAVKKGKWCDGKNKKDPSDQAGRRVMSRWETQCLRRVAGQEHLLEIIEAWEDVKAGATFIRTEFINGYSLADWIEWSPRGNWRNCAPVAAILYQVNQGLLELESCGVTHADIKLGNVMVRHDGRVVLVDFGLAQIGDAIESLGGTEGFVPSEARRRVGAIHGSRDVFAVGQTMNLLLDHKCWRTPLQPWETGLRRIVISCCDEDHAKRLTPQRILTELYRACAQHGGGSDDGSRHIIRRQLEMDRPVKPSVVQKAWRAAKCRFRVTPFI
ncbi:polo-like kinase 3 [Tulasnella sp. 330]|nr:polo-like kinase 3 [Tulasnella sp. 330]